MPISPHPEPRPDDFPGGSSVTDRGVHGPTFARFVLMLLVRAYRMALSLGVDEDTASDIAADVVLAVWKGREKDRVFLDDVDIAITRTNTWTINKVRNIRKAALGHEIAHAALGRALDEAAARWNPVEGHTLMSDLELKLSEGLQLLPPGLRNSYILVRLEGFSSAEAARMLGVTPQRVRNNVCAASKIIIAYLTTLGYGPTSNDSAPAPATLPTRAPIQQPTASDGREINS